MYLPTKPSLPAIPISAVEPFSIIGIIGNKKFSGWFLSLKATNLIASGKARFYERHPTFHK